MAPQSTGTNGWLARVAVAVNHPRDQFLAGAGFAFDQHGGVGGRGPRDRLIDLDHARRTADHFGLGQIFGFDLVFVPCGRAKLRRV